MKVIEYFTSRDRERWLTQLEACGWSAGRYLAQLLREGELKAFLGETALVLLLTEGDELVSFCTLAPLDDVQPTALGPWIGFVCTMPERRGQGMIRVLLDHAESLAAVMGREAVYISTDREGLYERYGYTFLQTDVDVHGGPTRVYRKLLPGEGPEKERMHALGGALKAAIVAGAWQGVDPVSVCGLSCDHCFLGQWCGGCKSCFNCCSFGTLFEKGKCPNIACAQGRGLEGCYACGEVAACEKGFYAPGNDGANASRAQALFIRAHGKERFLQVQDRLHGLRDFQKVQEVLSQDLERACRILEKTAADLDREGQPKTTRTLD